VEKKCRCCHWVSLSPPPQRHREQPPASPPAQSPEITASGNSSSSLAAGPNSSSCLQNYARSACKKKIISRLLCMHIVTDSLINWLLCSCTVTSHGFLSFSGGLEHQPSPRGWAESSLVAGPIQAQPSPFYLFIIYLFFSLFVCFFYYISIVFKNL
jgi:hypothetical protein